MYQMWLKMFKMTMMKNNNGAIAQLGERLHGMQEVGGSIPPSSTKIINKEYNC